MSWLSIGRLSHLARNARKWEVRNEYLLEPLHHTSVQRIELLDLTGDGMDDLVVESNWGGAATVGDSAEVKSLNKMLIRAY